MHKRLTGWALIGLLAFLAVRCWGAQDAGPRGVTLSVAEPQDRWAILVGISAYPPPLPRLKFGASDARKLSEALQACGFSPDHILVLDEARANRAAIRSALEKVGKTAGRDDLLLFYFAGHGMLAPGSAALGDPPVRPRQYLLAHDSNPRDLANTALDTEELAALLHEVRPGKRLVLLDACRSGGALLGLIASPRQPSAATRPGTSNANESILASITQTSGSGTVVITASRADGDSYEYEDIGGIFTDFIVKCLMMNRSQNEVTHNMLIDYIQKQFASLERGRKPQIPTTLSSWEGAPIIIAPKEAVAGPGGANGFLKVTSSPLGALVLIDGKRNPEKTPLEISLPVGAHQITLIKEGFAPTGEEVYVAAGRQKVASYVLSASDVARFGDLLVIGRNGWRVTVEGKPALTLDQDGIGRLGELEPREYRVHIDPSPEQSPKRQGIDRTVRVEPGRIALLAQEADLPERLESVRRPEAKDLLSGLQEKEGRYFWKRDGAEMVFVSEGSFWMGRDRGRRPGEEARRQVSLSAFWIDRCEVSNRQFEEFVKTTGHPVREWKRFQGPGSREEWARLPATQVTWHEARAYAEWAGKVLPTEAQWEKAARGPDDRLYPYGPRLIEGRQNLRGSFPDEKGENRPLPVGLLAERVDASTVGSPYGTLDMLGNVAEWCSGPFDAIPIPNARKRESGKDEPPCVVRGGSYLTSAGQDGSEATVCLRESRPPSLPSSAIGFRCVTPLP